MGVSFVLKKDTKLEKIQILINTQKKKYGKLEIFSTDIKFAW